jgi:hypothetical protein
VGLDTIISSEPSVIEEVLYKCSFKKYNIKEIPIVFHKRRSGKSKLGIVKLIKVLKDIIRFKQHCSSEFRGFGTSREFRKFGFNLALGLNIVGFIMFLRHKPYFSWFTAIGLLVLILAMTYFLALKPIKKISDALIFAFGRLVSIISMLIIFYLIFTPAGILLRVFRKDILDQGICKSGKSYWIKRKTSLFSPGSCERMG